MKHIPFIVITGGPGAGKTAILELARKQLSEKVAILPEAASVLFQGGFWRLPSVSARKAAQRAIFHVQTELEQLVIQEGRWSLALCDRGAIDGLAYWPGSEKSFWHELKTTKAEQFSKYDAVIHLRTPTLELGYNHNNPVRIETAQEAAAIDERIAKLWRKHPNYFEIESSTVFLDKAKSCISKIESFIK